MARILLLETSTPILSVALAVDGRCVCEKVCREPRMQASLTAPLVKEVLDSQGITVKDCDAVCVSKGPGSYTGLRVGVSTAKGLAFGAGIPLIAICTLDALVAGSGSRCSFTVPMIDARRMEVYAAVYDRAGNRISDISPIVVAQDSFADYLEKGSVLFTGDGALKCKDVITHPNAVFQEAWPMASSMAEAAEKAWNEKRFEDLAYFEPFYLKDFVATVSRKNLF